MSNTRALVRELLLVFFFRNISTKITQYANCAIRLPGCILYKWQFLFYFASLLWVPLRNTTEQVCSVALIWLQVSSILYLLINLRNAYSLYMNTSLRITKLINMRDNVAEMLLCANTHMYTHAKLVFFEWATSRLLFFFFSVSRSLQTWRFRNLEKREI